MNWLVPFKGRNSSGAYDQNFLYQNKNVFVMDNHRSAMWCWLSHFSFEINNLSVFHLDRHSDAVSGNIERWRDQFLGELNSTQMDINTYLELMDAGYPSANLITWDNYLSIFLDIYSDNIRCCLSSYYQGDELNHREVTTIFPWEIPENLDYWLRAGQWVVNIDLDYFFHEVNDDYKCMYSQVYIHDLFNKVAEVAKRKEEIVVTIAFSPECCGSWENAERIWEIAETYLQTGMQLD